MRWGELRIQLLLALLLGWVVLATSVEAASSRRAPSSRGKGLAELRSYQLQRVQLPVTADESLSVTVVLDGEPQTLELESVSLRSNSFQVLVQGEDGTLRETNVPRAATYRGKVAGMPGSRVVASLRGGSLSARVELGPDSVWHVEPLRHFRSSVADAAEHVVYRDGEVVGGSFGCGSHSEDTALRAFEEFAVPAVANTAATAMKICDIAFDADFEFYQLNGSSVTNTVRDIEDILNRVALIYEDQLNITFELTTIIVRTAEPDPYTSTNHDMLLTQMRSEWNLNRTNIHRDIAHMMTGKEIDGIVIGSTFTGTICETCNTARGYGFSQSRFSASMALRTCLTAHELGHSFGATHCDGDADCFIMCSLLNQCGQSCTQFGARSRSAIAAEVASVGCLNTLAPPLELPFCDTFDLEIDRNKWSFNAVASFSTAASAAPSAPGVMLLDNCCTACTGQANTAPDEIRSNYILLGSSTTATLSYHTEHLGGAGTAGSRLFVEYENDQGEWIQLNAISATGSVQTSFVPWSHALPGDALHDGFRLRFRLERASAQASWFVDDVSIREVEITQPVLYVNAAAAPGGDGSSWAAAYRDVQDALNAANCSLGVVEEIWVAAGTYYPDRETGDRRSTFRLLDGISMYGGFRGIEVGREARSPADHPTILSGDIGVSLDSTDNLYHVVTASSAGPETILDGFEIRGGNANGTAPDDGGGGVLNAGGSPTIRSCTIAGNSARVGGAMQNNGGASPTLEHCVFAENHAISAGGAMHCGESSTVRVRRSRFLKNTAGAAGGALFTSISDLELTDSLFSGNSALSGGALQNFGSVARLINCTLSRNSASGSGGGIVNLSSVAVLEQSILWGNSDLHGTLQSSQVTGDAPTARYTTVQGWDGSFGGVQNNGSNPLLVDADGVDNIVGTLDDNPRLGSGSPAIDSGEPEYPFEPGVVDLDGRSRVMCDRVDRGAFEFGIGDYDCSGAVNLDDFEHWSACMTGPNNGPVSPACQVFDFDGDADVDLEDHEEFQRAF